MAHNRKGEFYLVVKPDPKWGYGLKARLAVNNPSLQSGEVAVKLTVEVPNALFSRPQLQAKVIIPESAVTAPVVDATVLDNVREVLSQQMGFDVKVSVVDPSEE